MDVSRRSFFKLVAGATALVAVPAPLLAENVPVFWGDGVHCDAAAFEAMCRGQVVEFATPAIAEAITCADGIISGGNYTKVFLSRAIDLRSGQSITVTNWHFLQLPGYESDDWIRVDGEAVRLRWTALG